MKKKIFIVSIVVVILLVGLLLLTGRARTDVYLKDFELSADGKTMTLKVGVTSSSGYVRKMKRTSGSTNGYYTFYSTFGINSKLVAKVTFEIELDDDMDEIYFYSGDKGYKLVLTKRPLLKWEKVNYANTGKLKIDLPDISDVIKVGINTYAQDMNYFEFNDKKTIEKIYNTFANLETVIPSTTANPQTTGEGYAISFDTNEDKERVEYYIEIYKHNDKYYVEQRYNGIYEVTEEDFNLIKSYVD